MHNTYTYKLCYGILSTRITHPKYRAENRFPTPCPNYPLLRPIQARTTLENFRECLNSLTLETGTLETGSRHFGLVSPDTQRFWLGEKSGPPTPIPLLFIPERITWQRKKFKHWKEKNGMAKPGWFVVAKPCDTMTAPSSLLIPWPAPRSVYK